MQLSTTESIPGKKVVKHLGLVRVKGVVADKATLREFLEKPDLGYFLEIKSRTWSRRDAEHKAGLALELIHLLGATSGETVTQDYIEVISTS